MKRRYSDTYDAVRWYPSKPCDSLRYAQGCDCSKCKEHERQRRIRKER